MAHSLARYAREVSDEVIWLEDSSFGYGGFVFEFYFYSMNESLNFVSQRKKKTEIMRDINCNLTINFGVSMQM